MFTRATLITVTVSAIATVYAVAPSIFVFVQSMQAVADALRIAAGN